LFFSRDNRSISLLTAVGSAISEQDSGTALIELTIRRTWPNRMRGYCKSQAFT
jgi:hypothetical protein